MTGKLSTTGILSQLIALDTTSRNSNLELIDYVREALRPHGVDIELTRDDSGKKANLFATLGGGDAPGVVLSGHTDVVPVDGQDWTLDPFRAEIRGERMFGRGTCDMKGFIAICLAKIEEILEADRATPVHFAFSYDEEVGCVGVPRLLDELKKRPVQPRACIIGEPTGMGVIRAHKGMLFRRCRVHGKSAHSSLVHHGVNAITVAARIIAHVHAMQQRVRAEGPFDDAFDPPYSTLHCGVIQGGTVNNIIPALCEFDFEIRNLPEQDALPLFQEVQRFCEELLPDMRRVAADAAIDWSPVADYPGMNTPPDAPLISEVSALLGGASKPGKVSYGTEGGHFQNAGISTVICGPGSIEQAHKPDEYIDLDQLRQGEAFLSGLIRALD